MVRIHLFPLVFVEQVLEEVEECIDQVLEPALIYVSITWRTISWAQSGVAVQIRIWSGLLGHVLFRLIPRVRQFLQTRL